jgi:diguanylate cyclase (GGDEF)-like protein
MKRAGVLGERSSNQALRMRLFLMGLIAYVGCGVLIQVYVALEFMPGWISIAWPAGVVVVNSFFYFAIRTDWNLRLKDASMTELQMVVAMTAALFVISQAYQGSGALLLLLPVPVLFGVLRLNFRQMARVGLYGVVGYGLVAVYELRKHADQIRVELELLNLGSLTLVMAFVCIMCGYISKIRKDLAAALEKNKELAERDPLTGLYNRRKLLDRLSIKIDRCEANRCKIFSLCIIDIDEFKLINDKFGHPQGDEVIQVVANCIGSSIRSIDDVFRYGGEEFVILLDDNSVRSAKAASERIRERVASINFKGNSILKTTVSIGVAVYSVGETISDFIARADRALYSAKAQGRNRIVELPRQLK